jgi:hypothetical protein
LYSEELSFSGNKKKVYSYCFYGIWAKLLNVFAKGESVVFLIHPVVIPVVTKFVYTLQLDDGGISSLADRCPILCTLFSALPGKELPAYAFPLFHQILTICVNTYKWLYQPQPGVQPVPPVVPPAVPQTNEMDVASDDINTLDAAACKLMLPQHNQHNSATANQSLLFGYPANVCTEVPIAEKPSIVTGLTFPFWPKIREHRVYAGRDKLPASVASLQAALDNSLNQWNDDNDNGENSAECTKIENKGYRGKDQVAGLFIACCPHTINYGRSVMFAPEGRKDLFKVLYERLPQAVLDSLTVIYDFACQAGEYCISREPKMFCLTKFLIDRFHSNNHKCASFWKLHSYPGFADLVSTASESFNAFIQWFHSQCAYMRQDTFMLFMELVTTVRNWLTNQRLKQHLLEEQ